MKEFSLDDFIDDFLQEATEHLQSINKNLFALERTFSSDSQKVESTPRLSIINDLFRSFHTLKGLSGMVGLRPAEELSHLMESVLRDIQKSQLDVNQEVIDRLFEGTKTLEAAVSAITKNGDESPDITPVSKSLSTLLETQAKEQVSSPVQKESGPYPSPFTPDSKKVGEKKARDEELEKSLESAFDPYPDVKALLGEEDYQILQSAQEAGRLLYLLVFSPSLEKAERGKNVNQLRAQIEESGVILKSIPLIKKDNIRFAFLVSRSKPLPVEVFQEAEVTPLKGTGSPVYQADEKRESPTKIPYLDQSITPYPHSITTSLRIDLDKLDDIMRLVSEMIVVKSRIDAQVSKLAAGEEDGRSSSLELLGQTVSHLDKNLRDMRAAVTRARMVPLSEVFNHMPLAVRDLTRAQKKEVRLVLEGEHTQIDKVMVEHLLDPLLHMIRNAITHGIESPSERIAAGKPAAGSLVLRGTWEGDQILIELADDGRGIDLSQIKEKALELGMLSPGQTVDESNLIEILARPGFSILEEAHLGAGRGIGMEVVLRNVRSVGGSIEVDSKPGKGTIFKLLMPLTLTILDAIIIRVGSERYAVPRHSVEEVIEIDPSEIVQVESGELIPFRQNPLVLIRLTNLFKLPLTRPHVRQYGLVCCSNEKRAALVVDQLIGVREVVVRAINDPFVNLPGIFGATDLGDGRAVLILDAPTLLFKTHG